MIQQWISQGKLTDQMDAYAFICDQDSYVAFSEQVFATSESPEKFTSLRSVEALAALPSLEYFFTPNSCVSNPLSDN